MFSWLKLGAKDSKLFLLLYEDAVKRVTEAELKRLREAFKKVSSGNSLIPQTVFVKDVLGENVPSQIAEMFFASCGGSSKGISFRDLLCGLVLLTRGTKDEKIKFLFGLYSNDSGSAIVKEDFLAMVQSIDGQSSAEVLQQLFVEKDSVGFDRFKDWLMVNPHAISLTRWLMTEPCSVSLSNDLETPTFYQTLCGVTHLEEHEMMELEKRYWTLKNSSRSGKLDLETLTPLLSSALSPPVCRALFNAFDENQDNHIDFKEMACGVSASCRGPAVERHKFCFKVFDVDKDGYLKEEELHRMAETLVAAVEGSGEEAVRKVEEEMASHAASKEAGLALGEYLIWAVSSQWPQGFCSLLFQICHIVLGLQPTTPQEEGDVIMRWLRRDEARGLQLGQFWYLVDMHWWRQWLVYTGRVPVGESEPPGERPLTASTLRLYSAHDSTGGRLSGPPQRPGPIDNSNLVVANTCKVTSLTGEGGKLRKNLLVQGPARDVQVVPQGLWSVLTQWYTSQPALPRQVILPPNHTTVGLELYPVNLRFLRHATRPQQPTNWTGMVGGYGASTIGTTGYAYVSNLAPTTKRYLAYVGAFSRMATLRQVYQYLCNKLRLRFEDVRLWLYRDENNMFVLEEEEASLEELGVLDDDQVLIEVRNKDLTWPEEMNNMQNLEKNRQGAVERGATGLNNLGNTCFMNAALQCVSNTRALTQYFTSHMHLYELNTDNPLGMKGHIALRYGDLVQNMWSGSNKTIAPLKLRWTIGKYAPQFNGFQQHDSQELLAVLLDGLHEDLNRVHVKPYLELRDSDGRPDVVVAQEAWENHMLRNNSIIVDLFHGQLKSKVTCNVCGHESVRFDPFNYLSLPLPMENYLYLTVTVMKLDGSVPVRYGLRLNNDDKYHAAKVALSPLCGIPSHLMKLVEVQSAVFKHVYLDDQKMKGTQGCHLHAYELPQCCLAGLDEEKLSISSNRSQSDRDREATAFTAIQRSVVPGAAVQDAAWRVESGDSGVAELDQCEVGSKRRRCMPGSMFCYNKSTSRTLSSASSSLGSLGASSVQQYAAVEGCVPYSSAHSSSSGSLANLSDTSTSGFVIALHRKLVRQDAYFLSSSKAKPSLFGLPVIVPCSETTTHQDLYQSVWQQVARLVSPLPPGDTANHAQDCDDSLGYEFPFTLKAVDRTGTVCAWCPWYSFCTGCRIQCSLSELAHTTQYLSIDWDPTALHLRYQTCLERVVVEHETVARTRQLMSEPIGLDHCLEAFTRQETLSEEEKVYCSKCKAHEVATKKLQMWRLPPVLIVHLKRLQFVNGKWVKSQKVVDFPVENFDPTMYLASVPQETVLRYKELAAEARTGVKVKIKSGSNNNLATMEGGGCGERGCEQHTQHGVGERDDDSNSKRRDRLESTSLLTTPIEDASLQDFHRHRLVEGVDPFDLKYNLYSVVCHSGMLSGGHYVSYACNERGVWYCYNDSSCRQVTRAQMDLTSAYMLFYERQGLYHSQYMPDVEGKEKNLTVLEGDSETDLKKLCVIH